MRQPRLDPGELRGVEPRQLHHRHPHAALVVEQFAAQRLVEALDGVLGRAVRGLQRDAPVGECGADLDDGPAAPGLHAVERGEGAVHEAEVGHLGGPAELLRAHLAYGGEHGGEGHVHPHGDRAQLLFDPVGCGLDGVVVADVDGQRQGGAARLPHVVGGARQSFLTPGQERDTGAARAERAGRRPADASAGAGDHDHLAVRARACSLLPAHRHLRCLVRVFGRRPRRPGPGRGAPAGLGTAPRLAARVLCGLRGLRGLCGLCFLCGR